ncbi:hypothetical protein EWZ93_03880 [Helicobacter pylori]|uniref:hypothetical protein n=1 Tax=Helicobacter pylori TaxID=210 RepID=UPI0013F40D3F|nr:hypothetical protein [Helicobacter pylori]NHA46235.1 hypothetical protein [Helicobacter pylori]
MFFKNPLNDPNYFKPENANNTKERANMPKNFGLLNYSKTSYSDFVNHYKPVETPRASKFSNFMENVGGYGGLGMLGGAIGGLGSLIVGAINFSEQNKNAKESMRMAKEQFELEKQRYNAREQERVNNREAIDNIAKNNADIMTRF